MVWLFKIDEVFWGYKPEVNEHYLFDVDDVGFDISKYDISLYFSLAEYYLLDDSNDEEIYKLLFKSTNNNPNRLLITYKGSEIYNIIKCFYKREAIETKINKLLND